MSNAETGLNWNTLNDMFLPSYVRCDLLRSREQWIFVNDYTPYRCSAFKNFAKSFDEISSLVDALDEHSKCNARYKFEKLILSLCDCKIYARYWWKSKEKRELIAPLFNHSEINFRNLAFELSEHDGVDLFVPSRGLIARGGDDFGFTVYLKKDEETLDWFRSIVLDCGLYLIECL